MTRARRRASVRNARLLKMLDDPGLVSVLKALASVAERDDGHPRFCRNCGDQFDDDAANVALDKPSGSWRPCPNPSPGRPIIDCGVGGHMYTDSEPRID